MRFVTMLAPLAAPAVALAGPLTPPAGAPASTNKTLQQVEPRTPIDAESTPGDADSLFRITKPGSYYLTEDINGLPGRSGIEIDSSDVTLDLNGFTLRGVAGSLDGVTLDLPGAVNFHVTNGQVIGWDQDGLDLEPAAGNVRIDHVTAANNTGRGVVAGANAIVANTVVERNASDGVRVGESGLVHDCVASGNTLDGVNVGVGSHISTSAAFDNGNHGYFLSSGASIADSTSYQNAVDNIHARFNCSIRGCASRAAGEGGVITQASCLVQFALGGPAISVGFASTVRHCVMVNSMSGVTAGEGSYIHATQATNNFNGVGFTIGPRSTVSDCHASGNLDGFDLTGDNSAIVDCTATENSGSGFISSGPGGNLIIRNRAADNGTNYALSPADTAGPIVNAATIAASANPHANYEY